MFEFYPRSGGEQTPPQQALAPTKPLHHLLMRFGMNLRAFGATLQVAFELVRSPH